MIVVEHTEECKNWLFINESCDSHECRKCHRLTPECRLSANAVGGLVLVCDACRDSKEGALNAD